MIYQPGILRQGLAVLLCVVLAGQMTACSFFVSPLQPLSVATDPPGARITINGELAGNSPLRAAIPRDESAQVMAAKPGYQTVSRQTSKAISAWGVLDIVGGCIWLAPFFGLLAPGAWEQHPRNIVITLPSADQR